MNSKGPFVFNQILALISRYRFEKVVQKYHADKNARTFTYWQQFSAMVFAQITRRESLRSLVLSLNGHTDKLYRLGFTHGIKRSTLAEANTNRDWKIFRDFAYMLINQCKRLNTSTCKLSPEVISFFDNVYAFDSSTIVLNVFRYGWANFRKTKSGVKLHTLYNLDLNIPEFIHITNAKVADVAELNTLPLLPNSMYVFDRGYFKLEKLFSIHTAKAFFIIRTKKNLSFQRYTSQPVKRNTGLVCDQTGKMRTRSSRKAYPGLLRRIKYYDKETGVRYVYLTNNLELRTIDVVELYKSRWKIELFFKWVKQHLYIKSFWGYSKNAVNIQIWTAISSYLLTYLVKISCKNNLELNEITQILSLSLFDQRSLAELLSYKREQKDDIKIQQSLF